MLLEKEEIAGFLLLRTRWLFLESVVDQVATFSLKRKLDGLYKSVEVKG